MNTRDRTKYRYFTIGIDRESKLLKCLEEDAKEIGSKMIAKVIAMRLNDYYQFIQRFYEGVPTTSNVEAEDVSKDNASEAASVWEMED